MVGTESTSDQGTSYGFADRLPLAEEEGIAGVPSGRRQVSGGDLVWAETSWTCREDKVGALVLAAFGLGRCNSPLQ